MRNLLTYLWPWIAFVGIAAAGDFTGGCCTPARIKQGGVRDGSKSHSPR